MDYQFIGGIALGLTIAGFIWLAVKEGVYKDEG